MLPLILRGSEDEGAIDLAFGVVGDAGDVVAEEVVGSGAVADAPAGAAEAGRGAVVDEGPCTVVVTHTVFAYLKLLFFGVVNDNTLSKLLLNSHVGRHFLANLPRIVRNFAPRFRKNTNYHE